ENLSRSLSHGAAWSPGCTGDWHCQGRAERRTSQRARARQYPAARRQHRSGSFSQASTVVSVRRRRLREAWDLRPIEENARLGESPRALSGDSAQAFYECCRVSRKVELHEKCSSDCGEALRARSCLGAAVEHRSSCCASG